MTDPARIRNFSIIAHIDHGKSTLADRLIEYCGGLEKREMTEQVLDSMDIEKERGITIKAQTVRLNYKAQDGHTYILNLMDTPGHVDFTYEVSRSLAACEGSLLVVDASQGVEAQTLANVYQAVDAGHEIIPVLNKVDLPAAEPDKVKTQIEEVIGLDTSEALLISAKTGLGIQDVLEAIVQRLPPPTTNSLPAGESKSDSFSETGNNRNTPHDSAYVSSASPQGGSGPLKALLVDSWYDQYLGVITLVRVFDGVVRKGMKIRLMAAGASYQVEQVGIFTPKKIAVDALGPGEMGYVIANIKQVADCKIGDTITEERNPTAEALPGFKPVQSVVFCGLYPTDSSEFEHLKDSLAKLRLNDASFEYETESSSALGFGFRCGFLGLLHLEIIQERLEREFDLDLVTTAPSVVFKVFKTDGSMIELHNPVDLPDPTHIDHIEEPWIKATILVPDEYLGNVLKLCEEKRGLQENLTYVGSRAMVVYRLPLCEVVFDFYDRLKSCSKGYASFDYHMDGYSESPMVKLTILVNSEPVDALAIIVHRSNAEARGRALCKRLKDLIPRHLFAIPVQAAIGGKIIARETISALRKDVLAKCYGGDITRKRKLLEKQKKGKKRMKQFGSVEIPQSAFIAALKTGDGE